MWVPAAVVGDRDFVAASVARSRVLYPSASARVLGTLWWYSASSVLVGPVVRVVVAGGPVTGAVRVTVRPDGLLGDARLDPAPPDGTGALRALLAAGIAAVAGVSGAAERALWAIATDSVGNQVLWSGGGPAHAGAVAAAVGPDLPAPRFARAGGRLVVRRASCCLIYEVGEPKCVSCPRQTPQVRAARLQGS